MLANVLTHHLCCHFYYKKRNLWNTPTTIKTNKQKQQLKIKIRKEFSYSHAYKRDNSSCSWYSNNIIVTPPPCPSCYPLPVNFSNATINRKWCHLSTALYMEKNQGKNTPGITCPALTCVLHLDCRSTAEDPQTTPNGRNQAEKESHCSHHTPNYTSNQCSLTICLILGAISSWKKIKSS